MSANNRMSLSERRNAVIGSIGSGVQFGFTFAIAETQAFVHFKDRGTFVFVSCVLLLALTGVVWLGVDFFGHCERTTALVEFRRAVVRSITSGVVLGSSFGFAVILAFAIFENIWGASVLMTWVLLTALALIVLLCIRRFSEQARIA